MAASSARRAVPAIVFIVLLAMISGLVWWRVLHRDPVAAKASSGGSTTSSTATRCVTVTSKPVAWPAPGGITISVLNATDRAGLAGTVTTAMQARGFKAIKPDNDNTKSAVTEVRYGTRSASQARLVQINLPGSRLVATKSASATIVVSVGAAYKALATPAQVTAARTKPPAVTSC